MEIKRKKRQPKETHYLAVTPKELNHLLDGCEDSMNIITKNPKIVGPEYRARLKRLKKRIESILEEVDKVHKEK